MYYGQVTKATLALELHHQLTHSTFIIHVVKDHENKERNYLLYTEDFGETWSAFIDFLVTNANEAKLVELNNGSLLLSIRQPQTRKFAMTDSLGSHWDWADYMPDVMDPGCNGEIKRYTSVIDGYEKDRLIAYLKNSRKNVTLMVSYDEDKTWPHKRSLQLEASTYSTFDIDKNGNIFVLYEESSWPCSSTAAYDIVFANVTLEWITYVKIVFKNLKN